MWSGKSSSSAIPSEELPRFAGSGLAALSGLGPRVFSVSSTAFPAVNGLRFGPLVGQWPSHGTLVHSPSEAPLKQSCALKSLTQRVRRFGVALRCLA